MTKIILYSFLLSIFFHAAFSQNKKQETYGLHLSHDFNIENCTECRKVMSSLPRDVGIGLVRVNNDIYFEISDQNWSSLLFKDKKDGLAVDIVSKKQYNCKGNDDINKTTINKGRLLPPVYMKELVANAKVMLNNVLVVKIGALPEDLLDEELEFNLLMLNDKDVCWYHLFYNLPYRRWALLEMGLFMDTLKQSASAVEKQVLLKKKWQFTIPFEKNKFLYDEKDVKPIYDSLLLNEFNIKSIEIRAFSSVEGPTENNIMLQQKRAESIVKALQAFQIDSIETKISASENWVEFMNDIVNTPYKSLAGLSKEEIKAKLTKQLSDELEPLLKNHRKAILLIELEKKTKFKETDPQKIKELFGQAIAANQLDKAMEIQHIIFSKVRENKLPAEFIKNLEIPERAETGMLFNNNLVFQLESKKDTESVKDVLVAFKKLSNLLPDNVQIKYNMVVLRLRSWLLNELDCSPSELNAQIASLKKSGIPNNLVQRLMINYHIINSEVQMNQRNYKEKDISVSFIRTSYKKMNLSQQDVLNLSEYFISYNHEDWALEAVTPFVKKIDVDEDLLFLYINMTIVDDEITKKAEYRKIILNAYNINKKRFCQIFNPASNKGITFQLLDNPYLKQNYCESCN